jgi:hypothetical protein
MAACGGGGGGDSTPPPVVSHWPALRAAIHPQVALTSEFGTPMVQPLAGDGWEDGVAITRDGLQLYALYVPGDLLSFTLAGAPQPQTSAYLRGPRLGIDLNTMPSGVTGTPPWLHGNLVHAVRASTAASFTAWQLTAMARPVWSEGAPLAQSPISGGWDLFAFTTNQHAPDYKAHICLARSVAADPALSETAITTSLLPAPVTTSTSEDNPHVERLDASHLVLFFDSDDRAGTLGARDIWYSTSADDGSSWTTPAQISFDDATDQQQPHLWQDGAGTWWLYHSATNPADSKLAIFRAHQTTAGDWQHWDTPQLVIGAGNAEGIGEPTLTTAGDLSFVVITRDPAGTATNRYDADPWFAPHLPGGIGCVTPRPAPATALARR